MEDIHEIDMDESSSSNLRKEIPHKTNYVLILVRWIYPLVLLFAGYSSSNIFSMIYVLGFLSIVLWSPNNISESRKTWCEIHVIFMFVISTMGFLGQIAFQTLFIIYRYPLFTQEYANEVLSMLGFIKTSDSFKDVTPILSQVIAFLFTLMLLILVGKRAIFSKNPAIRYEKKISTFLTFFTYFNMFLITIFSPTVYSTIFFLVLLFALGIYTFNYSWKLFLRRTYKIWLLLTVAQLLLIAAFQISTVRNVLLPYANIFGLRYYVNYSSDSIDMHKDWSFFLQFLFIIVFFFTLSYVFELISLEQESKDAKKRDEDFIIEEKGQDANSEFVLEEDSSISIKKNKHPGVAYYCGKFGWTLAVPLLFVCSVISNNVLSIAIIVVLFIGIWVPRAIFSSFPVRVIFYPFVIFAMFFDYLFQNSFFPEIDIFKTLGFAKIRFDLFPFVISINVLSLLVLGVYWHFYVRVNHKLDELVSWLKIHKFFVNDFGESWVSGDLFCKVLNKTQPSKFCSLSSEKIENFTAEEKLEKCFRMIEELYEIESPFTAEHFINNCSKLEKEFKSYLNKIHKTFKTNIITLGLKAFLEQTYKLSIIFLYVTSLREQGTAINTGFLFFFVVFLISQKIALKFWIFLVGYCEIVIMMLLIWQFGWFQENEVTKIIGLKNFGGLFNLYYGLYIYVITLILTTIQLYINRYLKIGLLSKEKENKEKIFGHVSLNRVDIPLGLKWFLVYFYQLFLNNVLYINYIIILCVAMFSSQTLMNAVYLLFAFICIGISFSTNSSLRYIKKFWNLLVSFSLLFLVMKYIYQFEQLEKAIKFPENRWISLEVIGIIPTVGYIQFFLYLLPDAVILLFATYQSYIFVEYKEFNIKDSNNKTLEIHEFTRENYPKFIVFVRFLQRFLIIHSSNLIYLNLAFAFMADTSVINIVIILIMFLSFHLMRGTSNTLIGVLILVYSYFFLLASYFFNLNTVKTIFGSDQDQQRLTWVGVYNGTYWKQALPYSILLMLLLIQRYSLRVQRLYYKKGKVNLFKYSLLMMHKKTVTTSFAFNNAKRVLSNLSNYYGFNFFAFSMLISAYIHNNLYSIVYVIVIGFYLFGLTEPMKKRVSRSPKLIFLLLLLQGLFLFKYILLLGPIPFNIFHYYHWNLWRPNVQFFFSVCCLKCNGIPFGSCINYVNWYFISDLISMMFLASYLNSLRLEKQMEKEKISQSITKLYKKEKGDDLMEDNISESTMSLIVTENSDSEQKIFSGYETDALIGEEDLSNIEYSIYQFYKSSFNFTLIFIFFAGALSVDFLSYFYVLFSLYFILRGRASYEMEGDSPGIFWLLIRIINYSILLLKIIFQIPWIEINNQTWPQLFGLSKFTGLTAFKNTGIIFDLIILLLLSFQKSIFESDIYKRVNLRAKDSESKLFKSSTHIDKLKKKYIHEWASLLQMQLRRQRRIVHLEKERLDAWLDPNKELFIPVWVKKDINSYLEQLKDRQNRQKEFRELENLMESNQDLESEKFVDTFNEGTVINNFEMNLGDDDSVKVKEDIVGDSNADFSEEDSNKREIDEDKPKKVQITVTPKVIKKNQDTSVDNTDDDGDDEKDNSEISSEEIVFMNNQNKPETEKKNVKFLLDEDSSENFDKLKTDSEGESSDKGKKDMEEMNFGESEKESETTDSENKFSKEKMKSKITKFFKAQIDKFILWCHDDNLKIKEITHDIVETEDEGEKFKYQTPKSSPPEGSRFYQFLAGLFKLVSNNTAVLVYFMMIINHTFNANLLSLVFVVSLFGYALLLYPEPKKGYWVFMMTYTVLVIWAKVFYQISIFCCCYVGTSSRWGAGDKCFKEATCQIGPHNPLSYPYIIGIYKFFTIILISLIPDLLVFISLVIHRSTLRRRGIWQEGLKFFTEIKIEEGKMERRRTAITSINRKDRLQVLPLQPYAENLGPRLMDDEKEAKKEEAPGYFSWFLGKFVRHHERLRERYLPLEDYYVTSLVTEFLCFFLIVFFPSDFTGVNSGDGASLIAENRIPILFLLAIFSQFLLIMMDRVIWIRKWITFKIILQYALVFIYHFWLFFWLPFKNGTPFVRSPALVIFYLLKCWYFFWNSKQISVGFPLISTNSLTKQYGLFNYAVFQIYRAIPFVYELRTLLDWACLPTTLDWFQWLKVEDIYSNLYIIQCRNAGYKREGRKLGDTQAWYMKLGIGVGVVLLICLIVWFPLFILSGANPSLAPNPAIKLKLSLSFSGYASFYSAEQDVFTYPDLNHWNYLRGNYSFLEEDDRNNIQIVQVPTYSESRWLMTPPGIDEMVQSFRNALRDPTKPRPTLIMSYTFTRNKTAASLVLTGESSVQIKENSTIAALIRVLDSADNHQQSMNITIPNLYRRFMRLPLTGDPVVIENKQNNYVNISISLTREYKNELINNISYPSLMTYWNAVQEETDPVYKSERITLYPISLEVPTFLAGLVSVGIIGLYVGVVLTIGRFIRLMFVDLMPQIMFMDLEEPKKLLEFCEDINIVRNYVPFNTPEMKQMKMRIKNYFGGKRWIAELNNSELGQSEVFQLEEQMYYQLIDIYKNPNKLIKVTKFKND